jgi:hypothetical protein
MKKKSYSTRTLRSKLLVTLSQNDWSRLWAKLQADIPAQHLISPLFSALFSTQDEIHWRAVSCIGEAVSALTRKDLESARVVMRRLMWSLNDESGGIGWGAPEAMGEIMARQARIAEEYASILCSYIVPSQGPDNYLEYRPLRQGAYWGIARLAKASPGYIRSCRKDLEYGLQSETDPKTLILICLALTHCKEVSATTIAKLHVLSQWDQPARIYWNNQFQWMSLSRLAQNIVQNQSSLFSESCSRSKP